MANLYRQRILEGLAGPLDRDLFEASVVDLLRHELPVVPIRGGNDAGMDGAVADGQGRAFPVVTTTAKDVIGNLTKNLDSYLARGGSRRRVVLATSQSLTPERRRHLEDRAEDKGFTLIQVYERQAIADRLYRNSSWTKELLNVTGRPSALSELPRTRHPIQEIPLIGREADLAWLEARDGDGVVVGQPGSGKTYLLLQLVRQGRALFAVDEDLEALADACRDLKPEIVLVDDAHLNPERLDRLRHLRQVVEGDFKILASTWSGSRDQVASALAVSSGQVRDLELLTRADILEVLREIGVREEDTDPYVRFLVDGAANKPGLAVVLGSLWLRGELEDLFSGHALRRTLIPSLERIVGTDPSILLACYALGGTRGLSIEVVGSFLQIDRATAHRRTVEVAHGGLVSERNEQIVVPSELLRSALLRQVFFSPAQPSLPFEPLLRDVPSLEKSVEALVYAFRRGAEVPRRKLEELIEAAGSADAWSLYAAHDESAAVWTLEHHPRRLTDIASSALVKAPRRTIEALLEAAAQTTEPMHSQSHPLRPLEEWLKEIIDPRLYRNPVEESLRRREIAVEVACDLAASNESVRDIAEAACILALSPRLEGSRDSVTGDRVSFRQGLLPASTTPRMLALWPRVRSLLHAPSWHLWPRLTDLLHKWVYPEAFGKKLTEDDRARYREVARRMLLDLAGFTEGRPGLAVALEDWGERAGVPLEFDVEDEFRILFPADIHDERGRQGRKATELARRWSNESPDSVARRLVKYEKSAAGFVESRGWHTRLVFHKTLAATVEKPEAWLSAFLEHGMDAKWLSPLMDRFTSQNETLDALLSRCLEDERYVWLGARAAIRSDGVSKSVLDEVLQLVPEDIVQSVASEGEIPLPTLRRLLQHPKEAVSMAAVIGEWLMEPQGGVREEVASEWRQAMLRIGEGGEADRLDRPGWNHWLKAILAGDEDLAGDWLRKRIAGNRRLEPVDNDGLYATAIRSLDEVGRKQILEALGPSYFADQLVDLLVDGSVELYRHLLAQDHLREQHLRPLGGRVPDPDFVRLAGLALDAGHEPEAIAAESFLSILGGGYAGSAVDHWSQWKQGFEWMLRTTTGKLREVAEHGIRQAEAWIEPARREERLRALEGF